MAKRLQYYPRLGKNKISLTTLLIGLVSISVLLTFTILLFASYQSNKQSLFITTQGLNYSTAAKMSQTMDSLFKSMRDSLVFTAAYLSDNRQMSEQEIQQQLELLRHSSSYFNSLVVIDEHGIARSIAPASVGKTGQQISTPASWRALASRKPYISEPYTSATGRLIVLMSEPLFDRDGKYRGFIGGTIYLEEPNVLNTVFGNSPNDESGSYLYVVDTTGHLVFHPDKRRLGENVSANQVVQKVLQGNGGHQLVVNTRGVTLLAGYSPVTANGWGIIVNSPIGVVQEQLYRLILSIFLYTLLPFIVLLAIAIWIARKLASPFVSLADLVARLGQGARITSPDAAKHWNREADLLTRTITDAFHGLQQQTDQLAHAAMTDPLTGLTNRRTLDSLLSQWTLEQSPFSLIVMDIDRFKSINDTYGHQIGDEVLKHLARIVIQSVSPADICCRFGGEEFVVLLPHSTLTAASVVAERIRLHMEQNSSPGVGMITVSLGVAHYPSQASNAEALFHLADQALYKAKETGRNRTVVASTDDSG
ncbi:sensor domain-containing diguanylate cyclase [Paenibacillus rigui]|uniref:Diguanylate cyclase n=1 Tax=Paenibacillus rigui TaxID=554312 RepID=A0A229ULK9_9BACL|nr:sensor domain-containing diguanylate cyclase [Paenibacillus rigui]OXM84300.1 diguanylate cyclase [Paenibacillus rigui]